MGNPQSGLTLIELMITLAIVVILASLVVPMREMVMNNRRAAAVNELLADINYARNEAITRGQVVSICRSANQTVCGNGAGWESGWIIFLDPTTPGVLDDANPWPAGQVIKVHGPLINSTLRGNGNVANRISFNAAGTTFTTMSNGTLMACDLRGTTKARRIVVAPGGRVRSLAWKAGDPETCP